MSGSSDGSRGFCTNCGAEVREGNTFCHVCGASLEPTSPEQPGSFGTTSSGEITATFQDLLDRAVDFFWSLPTLVKIAVAALVILIVGIFLSPVLAFVFAVVAVGAVVYAIFQLRRSRPSALPFGIAAASVILFIVFIGVGSLIYGEDGVSGTQGSGDSGGSEGLGGESDGASAEQYDDGTLQVLSDSEVYTFPLGSKDFPTPQYQVWSAETLSENDPPSSDANIARSAVLSVSTEERDVETLRAVVSDVASTYEGRDLDIVRIAIRDSDEVGSDGISLTGPKADSGSAVISYTNVGEDLSEGQTSGGETFYTPEGYYQIRVIDLQELLGSLRE